LIFAYFAAFLGRLSPHCQPLFYFFLFFWEKNEFWGITQNWVMTFGSVMENKLENTF
jgi:hypothetical protein